MCICVYTHVCIGMCVYYFQASFLYTISNNAASYILHSSPCVHVVFLKQNDYQNCIGYMHCKYFSQTVDFLLILWDNSPPPFFFFGNLSALMSQRCFHTYSYKCCNVLLFIYRYLTHLELIFEYGVR